MAAVRGAVRPSIAFTGQVTKVYIFGPDHMTKMAAMPIYGKTLKHLLQNHRADYLETYYGAFWTLVL